MKTRNNKAWFLVLPVILVVSFTALIPLMTVANYSLQDVFSPDNRLFVGMKWFYDITNDPLIINAFQRSFQFSIQALLIQIPLGIAIARIMPKSGWKASAALVAVSIPLIIPFNVIGSTWLIFSRKDIGLGGFLLNKIFDFDFTSDPKDGWGLILTVDVWHWTPLVVLLVYAGLRSIPQAYYQAAAIDGASSFAVFRYVELPKLRRVLLIALLLRFMDSFMIYTEPFVITGGGPGDATTFASILLTNIAVGQFDVGRAGAYSLIFFLLIQIMSFIFYTVLTLQDREEETKTK